jgi:hypothetical protein
VFLTTVTYSKDTHYSPYHQSFSEYICLGEYIKIMTAIIVKENGEQFETPLANLENVKRLIKYTDIIYPGEVDEMEEGETKIVTKPTAPKAVAKKPVKK